MKGRTETLTIRLSPEVKAALERPAASRSAAGLAICRASDRGSREGAQQLGKQGLIADAAAPGHR